MPGLEYPIQNPKIFQRFADDSRDPNWATSDDLQAIVDLLADTGGHPDAREVLQILCRGYVSDADFAHFCVHWLGLGNPDQAYWRSPGPLVVAKVLRRGMLEVCTRFQETGFRCDYRWLPIDAETDFKLSRTEYESAILVLLTTPRPDYSRHNNVIVRGDVASTHDILVVGSYDAGTGTADATVVQIENAIIIDP